MPDKNFWEQRWADKNTGWDLGYASPPLAAYIDQLENKDLRILIPGAGNAYEAEYLHNKGFRNTTVLDISPSAIASFRQRVPDFPEDHLINGDFFAHNGRYDLILEQTFFCALDPQMREAYAKQMHHLLVPGGKLTGLLFDDPLNTAKPPYGGTIDEYRHLFKPYFTFKTFEKADNSIKPRAGREIFMVLERKQ